MKIKTSRNLHWKEICLVGMIILNSITVITIYDTNILGFTNTITILHPSAKDSSAAPVNTSMIQGHKGTTHTTKSNNADTNAKTIASNTEKNFIAGQTTQTSTVQTTSSLSQTQTSNGVSQANFLVNDTTETLYNTFLNL